VFSLLSLLMFLFLNNGQVLWTGVSSGFMFKAIMQRYAGVMNKDEAP